MRGVSTFGPSYVAELDGPRLKGQAARVHEAMIDGKWRTLPEIEKKTGDPQASISAQLRHLRKARFGSYRVDKRRRGADTRGLWEYRLREPLKQGQQLLFGEG